MHDPLYVLFVELSILKILTFFVLFFRRGQQNHQLWIVSWLPFRRKTTLTFFFPPQELFNARWWSIASKSRNRALHILTSQPLSMKPSFFCLSNHLLSQVFIKVLFHGSRVAEVNLISRESYHSSQKCANADYNARGRDWEWPQVGPKVSGS